MTTKTQYISVGAYIDDLVQLASQYSSAASTASPEARVAAHLRRAARAIQQDDTAARYHDVSDVLTLLETAADRIAPLATVTWDAQTVKADVDRVNHVFLSGFMDPAEAERFTTILPTLQRMTKGARTSEGAPRQPQPEIADRPFSRIDVFHNGESITKRGVNGRKPTAVAGVIQAIVNHAVNKGTVESDTIKAFRKTLLDSVKSVVENGSASVDVGGGYMVTGTK